MSHVFAWPGIYLSMSEVPDNWSNLLQPTEHQYASHKTEILSTAMQSINKTDIFCSIIFVITCILMFTYWCCSFAALRAFVYQRPWGLVGILVGAGRLCHFHICHHMYTDDYLLVLLFCSPASPPLPGIWRVGRYFGGCWSPLPSSYLSSHVYWCMPYGRYIRSKYIYN